LLKFYVARRCHAIGVACDRAFQQIKQMQRARGPISIGRVARLGLIAFVIGFGLAHYWINRERTPLLIAPAVPLSSGRVQTAPPVAAVSPPVESIDTPTDEKDRAGAQALAALLPSDSKGLGSRAPDFSVQDLEGRPLSLSALKGKVVVLNLWATWCGICQQEMPTLDRLYGQFKDREDFALVAVCIDDEGDQSKIASQMERGGYHFPVMIDPSGKLGDAYGVRGVPTTYVIDHSGRIAWSVVGGFDWSSPDLVQALGKML
jgi:peroxiredoxin